MWQNLKLDHIKIMEECRGLVPQRNLDQWVPRCGNRTLPQTIHTPLKHTTMFSIPVRNLTRISPQLIRSMTFSAKKFRWFPWARTEGAEKCGHFNLQIWSNIRHNSPLKKRWSQIFQNSTPWTSRERSWPPPKRSRIRRSEARQVLPWLFWKQSPILRCLNDRCPTFQKLAEERKCSWKSLWFLREASILIEIWETKQPRQLLATIKCSNGNILIATGKENRVCIRGLAQDSRILHKHPLWRKAAARKCRYNSKHRNLARSKHLILIKNRPLTLSWI